MNMRWAWTLPVLSALAVSVGGPASGQVGMGGPPAAMPPGYAQALAAGPQGRVPIMMPPSMGPPGMYMPPAMYPVQQVGYAGPGAVAANPDVYGSYGSMPVEFATQPHAPPSFGPSPYGPSAYGPSPYGPPGYAQQAAFDQGGYGGPMGGGPMGGGPMGGGPMGGGPMGGGPMGGPISGGMGMGGCQYCGGQGCPNCMGDPNGCSDGTCLPNGLLGDVLGLVCPYPDGGCAAPRWYDFAVDYVMMKRDNTGQNRDLAALTPGGPIVLKTDDMDFRGFRPGFRFAAALQIAAANSLEFIYLGQFTYEAKARATAGGNNLFSVFSDFGIDPPFPGFAEFDRAGFNQINYLSHFDSFEINWRCRWMAPNCRYQGSWTAGVRHVILDEKFRYATSSLVNGFLGPTEFIPARSRTDTNTTNDLTGLQVGTDAWICILPGLRAGGELQAGVYGNHIGVLTVAGSNLNQNIFREKINENNVSFLGQANLLATYRINYQWSLRGGYQFLYVNGVALAPENFNPRPPLVNNPFDPRVPTVHENGSIFLHGWNVGVEFMW